MVDAVFATAATAAFQCDELTDQFCVVEQRNPATVDHWQQIDVKIRARFGRLFVENVELAKLFWRIPTSKTVTDDFDDVIELQHRGKFAGDLFWRERRF